ncbi:hypothetical protein PMAL9190_01507 [Photobacterium malacitanum]|uniref:IrrE N-terminal-like domain-containing protein n=1 Tax=Photobacterium malacitanum TaxID=2204294 RepID=A0A1Y6MC93_9GAMM|nr:ImmA/IrrE family metallo-endopeptidase [Photobacterium malacitanum]SMY34122.1 hypothetical protein PMAL9190_01507 [Photobacterium malacitanum]
MKLSREWYLLTDIHKNLIQQQHEIYPVKIGAIAKSFNIKIIKSTLPATISGEIKETDGIVTIKVNSHDPRSRQRFTISHEIAHFLLHRHLIGNGISDDALYRSRLSNSIELEANNLAADILMPINLIKLCTEKHKHLKGEALYESIAADLDVSTVALKIRLNKA